MVGRLGGWKKGMGGCNVTIDGWIDGWIAGWIDGWIDERIDGWMAE